MQTTHNTTTTCKTMQLVAEGFSADMRLFERPTKVGRVEEEKRTPHSVSTSTAMCSFFDVHGSVLQTPCCRKSSSNEYQWHITKLRLLPQHNSINNVAKSETPTSRCQLRLLLCKRHKDLHSTSCPRHIPLPYTPSARQQISHITEVAVDNTECFPQSPCSRSCLRSRTEL